MAASPHLLATRMFRIAAVGVATLFFGALAAFVVAEEQCDANGGGPHCTRSPSASVAPLVQNTDSQQVLEVPKALGSEMAAAVDSENAVAVDSENASTDAKPQKVVTAPELGPVRLGVVLCMLFSILGWLLMMVKFACDGSLPARLYLWGLLPEAYAAISVRAVYHLLRLKTNPTPVIVLRNCITDESAATLAKAIDIFGIDADLQALEVPYNPQLEIAGLQHIMESVMRDKCKVVELDFSYNQQFGDAAAAVLRPALELKTSKISVLKLADIGLTHTGLTQIAKAAAKSKLRTLDLSWHSMRNSPELVASITEGPPMLEELILTCCDLEPDDVAALAEELPFTSIKNLQLGGNKFGSAGLVQLSEHLPKSMIDELALEAVGLKAGCEGLSALAAAWVKRPFARLQLRQNSMTDEEIMTFVKTLRNLQ